MSLVTLANGIRLNVTQRGPATGDAVLMLHGYSDSSVSYGRVLPFIPDDVRVIVPDHRGHGDSDRPDSGYTIDHFATDALLLLDALEVPRAIVVGHSMGTLVARRIAEKAPERVLRLVLVNGALSVRNEAIAELRREVSALSDPVDAEFVRTFQTSMIAQPVPDDFVERVIDESRKVPARVWKDAMEGMWSDAPAAHTIRCPAVVLGGDRDIVFTVAEQEAFAAAIPGARFELFSGFGHALPWEEPKAIAAALQ